ncbi:MAG: histidine kinase, partial [Casimicrobiaceae bacterium]
MSELIAYLRAAMPLMRSTTSTVGREIGLVRNYLEILNVRLGNRLAFAIDASAQFEDVEMPPMMLLPLVDHAIVHGLEKSRSEGTITIRIDHSVDRLRMRIVDSGAGFVPGSAGDGIAGIRERL